VNDFVSARSRLSRVLAHVSLRSRDPRRALQVLLARLDVRECLEEIDRRIPGGLGAGTSDQRLSACTTSVLKIARWGMDAHP
jgi:hypothetical protein